MISFISHNVPFSDHAVENLITCSVFRNQVLVRMPNGNRKERRFQSSSKVSAIYDYIDSLGTLGIIKYDLVTNFPRVVYGPEKRCLTLKEAGLHPHASLFVLVEDN